MHKNNRQEYEQGLCQRIRQDRRIDGVLRPWLKHKYAEIFTEFWSFYKKLDENNLKAEIWQQQPNLRNL